jgi:hypothetical protein
VARLLLQRDQARPVVHAALLERVCLLLLGQLDRREAPRLQRRGEGVGQHHARERDVPDPDPVGRQLGVDGGAQQVRLVGPEVERGQRLDSANEQPDGLLGRRVDELVEVAGRDRVGELLGVLDAERQHQVDVDVDAVRRPDRGHRDVERELAGRDDVGEGEERIDPVHARRPDRIELARPGRQADRPGWDPHDQARGEANDQDDDRGDDDHGLQGGEQRQEQPRGAEGDRDEDPGRVDRRLAMDAHDDRDAPLLVAPLDGLGRFERAGDGLRDLQERRHGGSVGRGVLRGVVRHEAALLSALGPLGRAGGAARRVAVMAGTCAGW